MVLPPLWDFIYRNSYLKWASEVIKSHRNDNIIPPNSYIIFELHFTMAFYLPKLWCLCAQMECTGWKSNCIRGRSVFVPTHSFCTNRVLNFCPVKLTNYTTLFTVMLWCFWKLGMGKCVNRQISHAIIISS